MKVDGCAICPVSSSLSFCLSTSSNLFLRRVGELPPSRKFKLNDYVRVCLTAREARKWGFERINFFLWPTRFEEEVVGKGERRKGGKNQSR